MGERHGKNFVSSFFLFIFPSFCSQALAKHIAYVHIHCAPPELEFEPYSSEFLRSYIAMAKRYEPFIPDHLVETIVAAYVNMREIEMKDAQNAKSYTTARTLLGILRLSQALARLRFQEEVASADVDEAIRLMNSSKISLVEEGNKKFKAVDTMSGIYDIIRTLAETTNTDMVSYDEVLRRVLRKGYRQEDLNKTIEQYEILNVLMLSTDKSQINFI